MHSSLSSLTGGGSFETLRFLPSGSKKRPLSFGEVLYLISFDVEGGFLPGQSYVESVYPTIVFTTHKVSFIDQSDHDEDLVSVTVKKTREVQTVSKSALFLKEEMPENVDDLWDQFSEIFCKKQVENSD